MSTSASTLTAYTIQQLTSEFEILLQDFYVSKINNVNLEIYFSIYGPYIGIIKTTYIPFVYNNYSVILR